MANLGFAERRKFIRLKAPLKISYQTLKKHRRPRREETWLINIGGGGLLILANEDLRTGDLLRLDIEVPNIDEAVRAVGEVVWFSHSRHQERVRRLAGIRFRDIDSKDLHRILEYIHGVGIGS